MGWDVTAVLERAAWKQGGDWLSTEWGVELRDALTRPADMFGTDRLLAELERLESRCPTLAARRALDCAFAEVGQGKAGPQLYERVVSGSIQLCAEDGIENTVTRIAYETNNYQAQELRKRLDEALAHCNFKTKPAPRKAKTKLTLAQGLNIALELSE
jgi:hypothetical protein